MHLDFILKKVIILVCYISIPCFSFCQNYGKHSSGFDFENNIQIELLGHGGFYSVNYERFLVFHSPLKTSVQIGTAYYPESTDIINYWLPLSVNQLFSLGSSHFEIGLGHIFAIDRIESSPGIEASNSVDKFMMGRIGYRLQPKDGRILLRVSYMPILDYTDASKPFSWGALAVGYAF